MSAGDFQGAQDASTMESHNVEDNDELFGLDEDTQTWPGGSEFSCFSEASDDGLQDQSILALDCWPTIEPSLVVTPKVKWSSQASIMTEMRVEIVEPKSKLRRCGSKLCDVKPEPDTPYPRKRFQDVTDLEDVPTSTGRPPMTPRPPSLEAHKANLAAHKANVAAVPEPSGVRASTSPNICI